MNYKTPGVYVEEVSLLPPSVAQVETAIPAFIGYTEKANTQNGEELWNKPTRIKSLLEYELYFGKTNTQNIEVTLSDDAPFAPQSVAFLDDEEQPYRMYQALQMYFANGGGPCFIVSVGDYDGTTVTPSLDAIDDYAELKAGLDEVRKIDEVTLLVFPEADRLNPIQYYDLYKDALGQCFDLKDRFAVFDVLPNDTDGSNFRDNIGVNSLSYGAAYYPYVNTKLPQPFTDASVTFSHGASDSFDGASMAQLNTVASVLENQAQIASAKAQADAAVTAAALPGTVKAAKMAQYKIALGATEKAVRNAQQAFDMVEDEAFTSSDLDDAIAGLLDVENANISTANTNAEIDGATSDLATVSAETETAIVAILAQVNTDQSVAAARNTNIQTFYTNAFLADVNGLLQNFTVQMPASSAVVGIYARTDETRGVWKAPANVSVNMVNGPTVKVDNTDNDSFNVHPTGKSINVIRSFTGKGTMVWGARTLDGNSNEWRYVSVRRFFNMVEESVKKASEQFVFENNDANTWVKVKAMIENFLIVQWRSGALMGAKPEEAFFVNIGLGETMTPDDVFNGYMIVEIGMAVVRPAEFIILRFSHKMLES